MSGSWCFISHLFQSNIDINWQRITGDDAITDTAQSSLTKGGIEWWGWNSGQALGVGGCSRQENRWRNYLRFHNRLSTRVHEFLIPIPALRTFCDLCSISQTCCHGQHQWIVSSHWVKRKVPDHQVGMMSLHKRLKKLSVQSRSGFGVFVCLFRFWILCWNGKAVSITDNILSLICNECHKSWNYFPLLILNVWKSLRFFVNKFVFVLPMLLLSFRGGCLLFFLLILSWSWTVNTVNTYTCKIFA